MNTLQVSRLEEAECTVAIFKFPPMAWDMAPPRRGVDHPQGQKDWKNFFLDFCFFFYRIKKIYVLTYDKMHS